MVRLFALYAAQSAPVQFFYVGLPAIFREAGHSLADIALVHLAFLPWALKFLWAPLVDRFTLIGARPYRLWIFASQALIAGALLACAYAPPTQSLALILPLLFAISTFAATQDIAVDGWAVSVLRPGRTVAIGNAAQGAGGSVGGLIGGGALIGLYAALGWAPLYLLLAAAMLAVAVLCAWPAAAYPPRPSDGVEGRGHASSWGGFSNPALGPMSLVIIGLHAPSALAFGVLQTMLIDNGVSLTDLALLNSVWAMIAGFAGAIFAGWVLARFGVATGLLSAAVGLLLVEAAVALALEQGAATGLIIAAVAFWFAGAQLLVGFYALFMSHARRGSGAADFTLFVCLDTFVLLAAGALGTMLASWAGYQAVFAAAALLTLLLTPLVRIGPLAALERAKC